MINSTIRTVSNAKQTYLLREDVVIFILAVTSEYKEEIVRDALIRLANSFLDGEPVKDDK